MEHGHFNYRPSFFLEKIIRLLVYVSRIGPLACSYSEIYESL